MFELSSLIGALTQCSQDDRISFDATRTQYATAVFDASNQIQNSFHADNPSASDNWALT